MLKQATSVVILLTLAGCSEAPRPGDWKLAGSPAEDSVPPKEKEAARIHAMEMIRIFDKQLNDGKGDYVEVTADQLATEIGDMCSQRHPALGGGSNFTCHDTYQFRASALAIATCKANTYEQIASATSGGVEIAWSVSPSEPRISWLVPPQSEPARLAMLLETRKAAQAAAFTAVSLMTETQTGPHGEDCAFADSALDTSGTAITLLFIPNADMGDGGEDGRTVAAVVAEGLTSGERLMRKASEEAAHKMLSVAEWDRGSTDSFVLGQERAFSREGLSRASAAHLLVGGSEGLRLSTAVDEVDNIPTVPAFCMSPALSPSGTRALAAFRQAGLDPKRVVDSTPTDQLVDAASSSWGSLRQRLALLTGRTITSATEELALTYDDFAEARQYLADEIRAFNRTRTATIGTIGTFSKFAGTSKGVPVRPDEYFTAIARAEPFWGDYYVTKSSLDSSINRDLASFEGIIQDAVLSGLNDLAPSDQLRQALAPIYVAAQSWVNNRRAIVNVSKAKNSSLVKLMIWAQDYQPLLTTTETSALTLVAGEDMLECALHGSVEGGACTLEGRTIAPSSVASEFGKNYETSFSLAAGELNSSGLANNRSYLVGKRPDGVVDLVASLPVLNQQSNRSITMRYAVIPEVERLAADMIRPSRDWCAHGAVECNDNMFDERLPLENELNDDGNGVENSWKYYLSRAKDAAAVADQLGEEYINAQLNTQRDAVQVEATQAQARERVEEHLEVLQQACGVSTDSDTLLNFFGGSRDLEELSTGACPCSDDTVVKAFGGGTHECVGGRCVAVPARLVAQQSSTTISSRLKRCLGAGQVIDLTTYGTRPVCVHNTSVAANLCLKDSQCPLVVPEDKKNEAAAREYCASTSPDRRWEDFSKGYKLVWDRLKFFETKEKEFEPLVKFSMGRIGVHQCRTIEKARKVDGGWFRLTPYSRLLGNDPGSDNKDCTPRSDLTAAEVAKGFGYDSNLFEEDKDLYKFPMWYSTDASGHANVSLNKDGADRNYGGDAVEMPACPTEKQLTDTDNLAKLDALPFEVKTRLLSEVAECMATRLENSLGKRLIAQLPRDVIEVLEDSGPTGAFPTIGGEYAQLVTDLRASLVQQHDNVRLIHDELRAYGEDLEKFRIQFEKQGFQRQLNGIDAAILQQESIINSARLAQAEARQDGALTVALFSWAAGAISTGGYGILNVSSIADAVHGDEALDQERRIAAAQQAIIDLKLDENKLNDRMLELDGLRDQLDARTAMYRHLSSIQGFAEQAKIGRETMDGKLAALENLRLKARRALDAATAAASPQLLQSEKKLQKVSGNVAELNRLRYEDAFSNATRLAFLAKRAIELRLGVRFSEMTERLPLLDAAPATWENDVCVASGIDYKRLQKASPGKLPDSLLNGFLGTYVRKLENVVDAYQLAYAFEEGKDSVAISLKDDVFRGSADCEAPSKNLLAESSQIAAGNEQSGLPPVDGGSSTKLRVIVSNAWVPRGCPAGTECVFSGDRQLPLGGLGDALYPSFVDLYSSVAGAGIQQSVDLARGRFVLSWYQDAAEPTASFSLVGAQGTSMPAVDSGVVDSHKVGARAWGRRWKTFDVEAGVYSVVVTPDQGTGVYRYCTFAAPMLEQLASEGDQVSTKPSPFAITGLSTMNRVPCRDSDGASFRKNYWTYQCDRTCGVVSGSSCTDSSVTERCYWETTFRLSEKEVEAGRVLQFGQFASGNFNYRLERVGLNVVATAPRDCSGIGGSSCYSMGYLPYSIYQRGPFAARNHTGATAELLLFDGRIEMAKALASERYLTSPLSQDDKGLLEPYMRDEVQGRPFDGSYVIRIWEDPTINFDAIEDIQLFLEYRYWTPAN